MRCFPFILHTLGYDSAFRHSWPNLKPYWCEWDIIAWSLKRRYSSELSEPAEFFSRAGYGIIIFEHDECQQKKNYDAPEQCPISEQKHVLKLGKNNFTKTWEAEFK